MEKNLDLLSFLREKSAESSNSWDVPSHHESPAWHSSNCQTGLTVEHNLGSTPILSWDCRSVPLPAFDSEHSPESLNLTDPKTGLLRQRLNLNLAEIADYLVKTYRFAEIANQLAYYRYPDWELLPPPIAEKKIYHLLYRKDPNICKYLNSYARKEITSHLLNSPRIYHLPEIPAPDCRRVYCRDGVYVWPDGSYIPPREKDFRFSHLEVSAQAIAPTSTPTFNQFLNFIAGESEDLRTLILEVIGVIISGYPCKKFFVFKGVTNSGKSQLARFLQGILGASSCFALNDISQLGDRWTTGQLPGKLLCLCSDVPNKPLNASSIGTIKQLTGDDPIRGEIKYRSPFVFQNMAKLLFLTNFSLQISGSQADKALTQRMIQVPFSRSVPEKEQIPHLYEFLLEEAGGIIWKSIQALAKLDARGGVFTQLDSPDNGQLEVVPSNCDYVALFVKTCCLLEQNASISVGELYQAFEQFTQNQFGVTNLPPPNTFSKILFSLGFPVASSRVAAERRYSGIQLLPDWKNISFTGGDRFAL